MIFGKQHRESQTTGCLLATPACHVDLVTLTFNSVSLLLHDTFHVQNYHQVRRQYLSIGYVSHAQSILSRWQTNDKIGRFCRPILSDDKKSANFCMSHHWFYRSSVIGLRQTITPMFWIKDKQIIVLTSRTREWCIVRTAFCAQSLVENTTKAQPVNTATQLQQHSSATSATQRRNFSNTTPQLHTSDTCTLINQAKRKAPKCSTI